MFRPHTRRGSSPGTKAAAADLPCSFWKLGHVETPYFPSHLEPRHLRRFLAWASNYEAMFEMRKFSSSAARNEHPGEKVRNAPLPIDFGRNRFPASLNLAQPITERLILSVHAILVESRLLFQLRIGIRGPEQLGSIPGYASAFALRFPLRVSHASKKQAMTERDALVEWLSSRPAGELRRSRQSPEREFSCVRQPSIP